MSVFDDITRFAIHVLRGDVNSAIHDVGAGIHDMVGGVPRQAGPVRSGQVITSPAYNNQPGTQVMVPPPPASDGCSAPGNAISTGRSFSPAIPPCCDRYSLTDGFLVDGATGTIWRFDERTKSFEEVPVNHNKSKQALVGSMIETRLSGLRSQYESEVLATVAPQQRQAQLATFEKTHLAPLREAAKAIPY